MTTGGSVAGGGSSVGGTAATGGSTDPGNAGSSSLGGAAPLGGSAGAGGEPIAKGPIDFSLWALQLPTGSGTSPTQVSSAELLAGFTNEYFYIAADGGQAYMDPPQGITTSGSTRCRTEMREQKPTGGGAAWPSTGTHSMTVEGAVTKISGGSVTIGQLFNGSDSIPLMELQYSSGHSFSLFYEESKGGGGSTDLKTNVALNTRYTFSLAMIDGKASVTINGKQVYSKTPSAGILANTFYFKFGNYDQSTSAGTPTTTPHSIVEAYKVDVVHQ
jgi:Alginate lyase